jgi:AcrR family transcriptional regulator
VSRRTVPAQPTGASSTRDLILREASQLFARKGYTATSTREIAEAVGIMQPSLFHHFQSKAAIASELISHNLVAPARVAMWLAEQEGSAAARLYQYLVFDVTHLLRSPYNLAGLDPDITLAGQRFQPWRELQQALRDARRKMIAQGIESGEFIPVSPDLAHHAVTGLVLGAIRELSRQPFQGQPEHVAESLASLALRALLRDPADLETLRKAPPIATGAENDR